MNGAQSFHVIQPTSRISDEPGSVRKGCEKLRGRTLRTGLNICADVICQILGWEVAQYRRRQTQATLKEDPEIH